MYGDFDRIKIKYWRSVSFVVVVKYSVSDYGVK